MSLCMFTGSLLYFIIFSTFMKVYSVVSNLIGQFTMNPGLENRAYAWYTQDELDFPQTEQLMCYV